MKGLGRLQTATDLLEKLRTDYGRIVDEPWNEYVAFDFFVTAEHMLDWIHPGDAGKTSRTTIRQNNVILQVCSHIANGSKHFEVTAKHHQAVKDAISQEPNVYWRSPDDHAFEFGKLLIELDGEAAPSFGSRVEAKELARRVLGFWESFLRGDGTS